MSIKAINVRLKLHYIPVVSEVTRKMEEEILLSDVQPSLNDLLIHLGELYGPEFRAIIWDDKNMTRSPFIWTLINGDPVHDTNFPLQEGDTVIIMPALAGG